MLFMLIRAPMVCMRGSANDRNGAVKLGERLWASCCAWDGDWPADIVPGAELRDRPLLSLLPLLLPAWLQGPTLRRSVRSSLAACDMEPAPRVRSGTGASISD